MGSLKIHPEGRVREYTTTGAWTADTVQQLFTDRVRERGARLAVVDPVDKADHVDGLAGRMTWVELDAEVDRLAAVLLDAGVRAGHVVGVQLPNTVEQVAVYLASWRIGAILMPLPVDAGEAEIVEVCNEVCVRAFVTAGRIGSNPAAERVASARPRIPTLGPVLSYGVGVPDGVVRIGHGVCAAADAERVAAYRAAHPVDPNDCLAICRTPGTEGEPRGVPYAHYELLARARGVVASVHLVSDDVMLGPYSMTSADGIVGALLPWLTVGCVLVQHQPFRLGVFARQVAEEKVTYTALRPAVLAAIEATATAIDFSTVTRAAVDADPLAPATGRAWKERYGIELVDAFVTAEGVHLFSRRDTVPGRRGALYPRSGHVDGTELKLVHRQTGTEIVERGVLGELRVKGPTVIAGYVNPARDRDPFDEDGFLETGDLFVIDGSGDDSLRFVDRAADLIVLDGTPVGSAELDMLVAEHPSVVEAAVIGCRDVSGGEVVTAVVVCRPGAVLALEELSEFLTDRGVEPHATPQRLVVSKGLPRNSAGRVLKRVLRAELSH